MERPDNPYAPPAAAVPYVLPAIPGQLELATRWSRYLAALVDGLASLVVVIPVVVIVLLTGAAQENPSNVGLILAGITGVIGIAGLIGVNLHLLAQRAQSIGKLAMGIRIAMLDGQKADFRTIALKRILPVVAMGMIPFLGGLVSLVDSAMIFRKDRRCLHDLIAGTVVVRV